MNSTCSPAPVLKPLIQQRGGKKGGCGNIREREDQREKEPDCLHIKRVRACVRACERECFSVDTLCQFCASVQIQPTEHSILAQCESACAHVCGRGLDLKNTSLLFGK